MGSVINVSVCGVEEGEGDAECPVVRRKTRRVFDVVMSDQKLREFGGWMSETL
jgi:hypothetical protein